MAAFPAPGPIDIIPGSGRRARVDEGLREACLGLPGARPRAPCAPTPRQFSWRASAEEFVRNLQPYPEPEKTRFWRRLRRLARLRRRTAPIL